ncbi:MAG TPA: hypothetical protein VGQ36_13000 [Thermoanaerobaculia bacterium]|jgi:hypothetical protein|nr:hypothetical protein [Thermoanaerobaculia bacterium]
MNRYSSPGGFTAVVRLESLEIRAGLDDGIEAIPEEELDAFGVSASHPARTQARAPQAFVELDVTFSGKLFAFSWREEYLELDPNDNESSISIVAKFGDEVTEGSIGSIYLYPPSDNSRTAFTARAEIRLSRALFAPVSLLVGRNVEFRPVLRWEYDPETVGLPRMVASVRRVEIVPSRSRLLL